MCKRSLGQTFTALLLILCSGGAIRAADIAPGVEAPLTTTTPQVAPPAAVLPQDVPKIEIPAPAPTPLVAADQDFLARALALITAERELAQLASERAETEEVKALGRELLTSHVKNGAALQELAKLKHFELKLPLENPQQEAIAPLKEKTGASFDNAFREYVAQDRSESIQLFTEGATLAKDPAVRGLSKQALVEIQRARPLAAAEAIKSAKNSREISKVALNPKPAQPEAAQQAFPVAATPTATAQLPAATPSAAVTPAAAPVVPAPNAALQAQPTLPTSTQVQTQSPFAGNRLPPVTTPPVATGTPTRMPPTAQVPPSPPVEPTPRVSNVNVQPSLPPPSRARTSDVQINSVPQTTRVSPSQSVEPAMVPSRPMVTQTPTTVSVPANAVTAGETRYQTPTPVLEGPAAGTRSTRASTRAIAAPVVETSSEAVNVGGTQYLEERPGQSKKRAAVTIEGAPRPRVIRRVNEAVVEENATPVPAPRKAVRRKFIFNDEDDEDEDDD